MYSRAEARHEELLWQPFPSMSIPIVMRINHDNKTVSVTDLSTGESFPCCPKCLEPYRVWPEPGTFCVNSTCEDFLQ